MPAGELRKNEALMLMIRWRHVVEAVDVDGRLAERVRKTYRDEVFVLHKGKTLIIFRTKTNIHFKLKETVSVGRISPVVDRDLRIFLLDSPIWGK